MNSQDFIRQSTGFYIPKSRAQTIWRIIHTDPPLLVGIIVLCAFGLFVLYSASDGDQIMVQRQALIMLAGLVLMFIVSQFSPHFFRRWAPSLYGVGLALLILVLFIGVEDNGARSWLDLLGLPSFQPSETLKIVVPLLMAWYLASRPLPPRFKHLFWSAIMILIPAALIVVQNDTGTAIMVAMSGVFVVLLAGIRWRIVFTGIFTLLLAGVIAISIKIVGLLLITGMLIIPAALARNISNNPIQMVILSTVGGLLSILIGLFSSLEFNTASGPSIIAAALFLFLVSLIKVRKFSELKK